jgi:hypothetical protein
MYNKRAYGKALFCFLIWHNKKIHILKKYFRIVLNGEYYIEGALELKMRTKHKAKRKSGWKARR